MACAGFPLLLVLLLFWAASALAQTGRTAPVLTIRGVIGPATADYVVRGLRRAATDRAPLAMIEIDTPGGLDSAMREVVRAILASPVPVVTHVSPGGGRAASAGTYILYASHIAAMAPGTNLGAATPVQLGGGDGPLSSPPDKPSGTGRDEAAKQAKSRNDAIAYIRALAELRGRNADWAEAAVRSAASLSATEAAARKVVDLVVTCLPNPGPF